MCFHLCLSYFYTCVCVYLSVCICLSACLCAANGKHAIPRDLQSAATLLPGARLQVHYQVLSARGLARGGMHAGAAGTGPHRSLQLGDSLHLAAVDVPALPDSF